jgi:hypothetical protein
VRLNLHHLRDHDMTEWWHDWLDLFHFKPRHGEQMRQLIRGELGVGQSAKPVFRELHCSRRPKSIELLEEAEITFIEQPKVIDAIAQHRQSLETGTKGKPDELLRVEAHIAQYRGVYLTSARHFQPATLQRPGTKRNIDLG